MRICSNDSAENQETDSKMCLVWNRKYVSGILACKCAVSVALSFFIWYSYFYYDCGCYGLVSWFQDFTIMGKIIIQISSYYFKRSWILTLLPTISDRYWIYNIDWVRRNIWAGYLHEVYPKKIRSYVSSEPQGFSIRWLIQWNKCLFTKMNIQIESSAILLMA